MNFYVKTKSSLRQTFFFLFMTISLSSLIAQPIPSSAELRLESFEKRNNSIQNSIFNGLDFENIGPTVFSGRVADIDVNPNDPSQFFVAYASGGVWNTMNNGTTFEPLFDDQIVMTIGDIAVDWNSGTVYAGTGEVNSSRSSYAGMGMFKSTDWGKTWNHIGLEESHHIGRILIDSNDPDRILVAVLGSLYSSNEKRGLYLSEDGGESWTNTLYVNENAGGIDLIKDPNNAKTVYASTWERTRSAWNFVESGEGSNIYKSTDGGLSWTKMINKRSGFPYGEGAGRIGLSAVNENNSTVLYAVIDNYFRRPAEESSTKSDELTKEELRSMDKATFKNIDKEKVESYLNNYGFPKTYDHSRIIELLDNNEITPLDLVEYVEDANSLLFDTPVVGAEVYRSNDGGKKWEKTHEGYLDFVYNSYGYYFGQIRTNPSNPNTLYIMGVPVLRSDDKGANWKSIWRENVHADHHALWVNPDREGHIILGNDGGINISYDHGENWVKCNSPAVGQFYAVAVDHAEPYNVYGGLQDNGVWMGSNNYRPGVGWHNSGHYPYKEIMGGDGMQIAVDTRDNETVYTGYQFGNYFRLNTNTGDRKYITPKHQLGDRPLRWNWQTPIQLSSHNQDIFYMASNKLHRSFDKGNSFSEISPDLTKGGKKGDVAYGTITSFHESPLKFGLIYAGTDDGLVHVTKDGGNNWTNISAGLPENMWVTRVWASNHSEGTVYLSLNGYRWDYFETMVYKSSDYGKTWVNIGSDIPNEPVNVIKEDPVNPSLIYVGTDHGLYISMDGGMSFNICKEGLPAVSIHDVVIHPNNNDLIVGTHGRSIYKSNVSKLQKADLKRNIQLFTIEERRANPYWGSKRATYMEANEPEQLIHAYTNEAGSAKLTILHGETILSTLEVELTKGFNSIAYDLTIDPKQKDLFLKALEEGTSINLKLADNGKYYLPAGEYTVQLKHQGEESTKQLSLK
ncbi:MAG: glycosyl hydrolase [Saprospiraceae bacterium]|nr:glycosyl hydrolase [Saprospiraceae bacterium]